MFPAPTHLTSPPEQAPCPLELQDGVSVPPRHLQHRLPDEEPPEEEPPEEEPPDEDPPDEDPQSLSLHKHISLIQTEPESKHCLTTVDAAVLIEGGLEVQLTAVPFEPA